MSRSDFARSGFLFLTILVAMIVFLDQQAGWEPPRPSYPSIFRTNHKKGKI